MKYESHNVGKKFATDKASQRYVSRLQKELIKKNKKKTTKF